MAVGTLRSPTRAEAREALVANLREMKRAGEISERTLENALKDIAQLTAMEPTKEDIKILDKFYEFAGSRSKMSGFIAKAQASSLLYILRKRGPEFLESCARAFVMLEGHALPQLGMLRPKSLKELCLFKEGAVEEYVKWALEKYEKEWGKNEQYLFRASTFEVDREEVKKYQISENAVFLVDVMGSLTQFARMLFRRELNVRKSRGSVSYTTEESSVRLYLVPVSDIYDTKEENERRYYLTTGHEASHQCRGSFFVDVLKLAAEMEKKGVKILEVEFEEKSLKLKSMKVQEEGKAPCTIVRFCDLLTLAFKEDAKFLHHLWNILEDCRIECWMYDADIKGTMRRGAQELKRKLFTKMHEEGVVKENLEGAISSLLAFGSLCSAADSRKDVICALRGQPHEELSEHDSFILEAVGKMAPKNRELLFSMIDDYEILFAERRNESTKSYLSALKLYDKLKDMPGKDNIGPDIPSGGTDIDPENMIIKIGEKGEGDGEVDIDDLPPELRKKVLDAMKKAGIKPKEGKGEKEGEGEKEGKPGEGNGKPATGNREGPEGAQKKPSEIYGDWREREHGKEDYSLVKTTELPEGARHSDPALSRIISREVRRLLVTEVRQVEGAPSGEMIERDLKREWVRDRKRGIWRPRDYFIEEETITTRSLGIFVLADASGSQGMLINGKRKIDYINMATHSLAEGLHGIPGLSFGYGYFQSSGREDTRLYIGKELDGPLRFGSVEPGLANRDGVAIRRAGKILLKSNSSVKILILVTDSMPADNDEYTGKYGCEDVQQAFSELRKKGIIPFAITVRPDDTYWKGIGSKFETVEQYLDFLYGRNYHHLIHSEKEVCDAIFRFVRMTLPRLRTVEYE